jgi:hypothetical protein
MVSKSDTVLRCVTMVFLFFGMALQAFHPAQAIAQEQFQVTRFAGITHRGFFDQPDVYDYTRGFPRVEFEVLRQNPQTWFSAKVRICVEGDVRKKKEQHPVSYENNISFPVLAATDTAFTFPLPTYFQDAAITKVTMELREGSTRLPSKVVLAKPRIVALDTSPTASYEDDYLSLTFTFSAKSDDIALSGRNRAGQVLQLPSFVSASLEADVKDLPLPPPIREWHYVSGKNETNNFLNVNPTFPFFLSVALTDRQSCRTHADSRIEIEPDPICKKPGPLLAKYSKDLTEGYMLIRLILPVRTYQGIRDYSFTFVVTNQSSSPKKKDPSAVSV